jgi:acyl dehydratase
MRKVHSVAELRELIGQTLAPTGWIEITQQRIDQFAQATGDHQWIHVDAERCRKESPFRTTVAHGFLTLSLLPVMLAEAVTIDAFKMTVNYGVNKVRFPAPVPVGSRVRGVIALETMEDVPGGVQLTWHVTMELDGADKPACAAEFISRHYA